MVKYVNVNGIKGKAEGVEMLKRIREGNEY